MLWEVLQNSEENICAGISFLAFSCEFYEIWKNTFFAEQHRTTASDYSSINSSEGCIGKQNYKKHDVKSVQIKNLRITE